MHRPRAARWRHTRFRWPTCPSTRRQRARSKSRCPPSSTGGQGANQMPPMCRQVLQKWGDARTPGVARGARCPPGGRQGGDLTNPAGGGTECPVACPLRPGPPPQTAGHAEGGEEAPGAAPEAGGAAQQGSCPTGLAPLAPLWVSLGTGSPHSMAPAHPGDLAAPADPAAMRDS